MKSYIQPCEKLRSTPGGVLSAKYVKRGLQVLGAQPSGGLGQLPPYKGGG